MWRPTGGRRDLEFRALPLRLLGGLRGTGAIVVVAEVFAAATGLSSVGRLRPAQVCRPRCEAGRATVRHRHAAALDDITSCRLARSTVAVSHEESVPKTKDELPNLCRQRPGQQLAAGGNSTEAVRALRTDSFQ